MTKLKIRRGLTMTIIAVLTYVASMAAFRPTTVAAQTEPAQYQAVHYLVVEAPGRRDQQQALLDKLGAEGWQLVLMDINRTSSFIFRR